MMSCIATIGNCAITTRPSFTNQQINSLICGDDADSKFVYYCFTQLGHALEAAGGGGSVYTNVSKSRFEEIELTLPPLAEQKAIASVLGALDDKIELNRRMNATLEAMARALFQSWFVDFDPVRAKLDQMSPVGADKNTSALFPVHLEDSPLGKVPVGWRALKFADVLTAHSARVGEDSVPEFSATLTGLSSRDERFKKQLSKSQSKNKRIVEGDLVFGFSREVINFGLMREPVGAVSPVYEVFKIDSSKIEPELLERLFRFNMPYYMDILKPGAREGKPIDREYLLRKHLLVPDIAVQRAFLATIQPWTDKIKANDAETHTLATLRDTLLPKLLSGDLSVNEREAALP
jgi:type I restriction enzyme S subunit